MIFLITGLSSFINDIKMAYGELCKAHGGITDFRAKLLAFLPIASGTGIYLLLSDKLNDKGMPHLLGISIFGFLITFGLFLYELRGIQICNAMNKGAMSLEEKLLGADKDKGVFNGEPHPVYKGFVGATFAALIIYPSVMGAWTYVGYCGFVSCKGWAIDHFTGIGIAAAAVVISMGWGWMVNREQRKMLSQLIPKHIENS